MPTALPSIAWRRALAILLLGTSCLAAEIQRAPDAPQPKSPADSAACVRVPAGFRLELVASEPLIQEPSCIAFDEFGRLFVTELHGYNVEGELDVAKLNKTGKLDTEVRRLRWEFMGGEVAEQAKRLQYGKLKLLTDTDGDGKMDKAEVWADDLPSAYGVIPAYGGAVVVAAPDIIFLADRDGDGKAEVRKTLYTGFHKREMERGINNPRRGPDNWIYIGAGGHGGTIERPDTIFPRPAGAKPLPTVELGHSDFRINLATAAIEPVTGRVGTFGLAMNDIGDRFPCSGGQPAVYALPMDYASLARNPWVKSPSMNYSAADYGNGFRISQPHPWRVRRRANPDWIKFYGNRETDSNYFTGGCGGEIYNADAFPQKYRGDFFYCEPSLNIVHRCELTRDGAGYKARRAPEESESEFLASTDQWFRPMNLRTGPDGALYIVDMYREIIEDYSAIPRFLQQQYGLDRGRDKGRIWRLIPDTVATRKSLAVIPENANKLTEERISLLLSSANMWDRSTAQRLILESGLKFDFDVNWTFRKLLSAHSVHARIHALHLLSIRGDLSDADLLGAFSDADYRVRSHALKLVSPHRASTAITAKLASMYNDADSTVRLHLAQALGHCPDSHAVLSVLAANHGHERWMKAAILSSVGDTGRMLPQLLSADALSDSQRELITPLAATLFGTRSSDVIAEVIHLLPKADQDLQRPCLVGFAQTLGNVDSLDLTNTQLTQCLAILELVDSDNSEIRSLALQVAAKLVHADLLRPAFESELAVAIDKTRPIEDRELALSRLAIGPREFLMKTSDLLAPSQPLPVQHAVIEAMGRSGNAAPTLLASWSGFTPDTRKRVLKSIFSTRPISDALLGAIANRKVRVDELTAAQRNELLQLPQAKLNAASRSMLKQETHLASLELSERITQYTSQLGDGQRNAAEGRRIFEKNCLNCHKLGESGHDVGPALGSVINKPDEAIVVEILDPASKIDSEYTSYSVVTDDGRSYTGVLASESPTSVTLKMEQGKTATVLRQDIEVMKESEVSLMPSNLHQQISPSAMRNLLHFMRIEFTKR